MNVVLYNYWNDGSWSNSSARATSSSIASHDLTVFVMPFDSETTLSFNFNQPQSITVKIYSMTSREISRIEDDLNVGFNKLKINRADLDNTPDICIINVNIKYQIITKKLVLN